MKFLITNDDGFDAPGLAALYHALSSLGDVRVVAPSVCHSAKGHAVNTHVPIRVRSTKLETLGTIDVVEGSPADCVRVGLCAPDAERPDFVVAGINPGANLGVDLFYSGTAAAAREAAILGVPSLAISRYVRPGLEIHWPELSTHVSRVVSQLIGADHSLPSGQFWNVNFPAIEGDQHPQEITFASQNTLSHDIRFQESKAGAESERLLEYVGEYRLRGKSGTCDVSRVFDEHITATAVDLCNTAIHPLMAKS